MDRIEPAAVKYAAEWPVWGYRKICALAVAALAAELGIEVLAVAESAYGAATVPDAAAAVAALGPLGVGDAVLVKGSRVAGLEGLAATLLDASGTG